MDLIYRSTAFSTFDKASATSVFILKARTNTDPHVSNLNVMKIPRFLLERLKIAAVRQSIVVEERSKEGRGKKEERGKKKKRGEKQKRKIFSRGKFWENFFFNWF